MLLQLIDTLALLDKGPKNIPAKAVIFDSCPGVGTYANGIEALTAGIKNPWARWVGVIFAVLLMFSLQVYRFFTFSPEPFSVMRKRILNPGVLPRSAPRTYIYSDADRLIDPQAVERNVQDAMELGFQVELEKFEGTPHVNHIKGPANAARYVDCVRRTWERGMQNSS